MTTNTKNSRLQWCGALLTVAIFCCARHVAHAQLSPHNVQITTGPTAFPVTVPQNQSTFLSVIATHSCLAVPSVCLSYTWSKVSGPGTVTFSPSANVPMPSASFSTTGTYVVRVSVTDSITTRTGDVTVNVDPPVDPPPPGGGGGGGGGSSSHP